MRIKEDVMRRPRLCEDYNRLCSAVRASNFMSDLVITIIRKLREGVRGKKTTGGSYKAPLSRYG